MKQGEMPSQSRTEGQTKALFIRRLERLIRLRREYRDDLNPLGLRLLDRAIYSTFQDCLAYGAGDEVRSIVAKHPVPGWDRDVA
ncbi:MAG TPA: hypothetical protein VFY10_10860 [Dehalococcoidia bacterium]|nr:hypothetical protein [Dehalococcoidia bacterium]